MGPLRNILVTGASGYIGSRLVNALARKGYTVRSISRDPNKLWSPKGTHVFKGDLLVPHSFDDALNGVDAAYYLVHSMEKPRSGNESFAERDRLAAKNFAEAAERAGIKRIIYLGALGHKGDTLSEHLKSRGEVGEILQRGGVPTTVLRAAIIIGAGGASFQMLNALVERLPVMLAPRWVNTPCQPISVDDALFYLTECLENQQTAGRVFDIGGPEVLSYKDMMICMAAIKKRALNVIPVPVMTPRLSAWWVDLVTPVPATLAHPLIDGLKNPVVCEDRSIEGVIPHRCLDFADSVQRALAETGFGRITFHHGKYHLDWEQWVPASPKEVFDFFGNPANLSPMTRPEIHFQLLNPHPTQLTQGTELNYRLKIFGVPFRWKSKIISWTPHHCFQDFQVCGPYQHWHHTHTFEPARNGTMVKDHVEYTLPHEKWTRWVHPLFVRRQLERIFRFRSAQLPRLLKIMRFYP